MYVYLRSRQGYNFIIIYVMLFIEETHDIKHIITHDIKMYFIIRG